MCIRDRSAVTPISLTMQWLNGGNPGGTRFVAEISTSSNFTGLSDSTTITTSLSASFASLAPNTVYYGQVWAVNYSGLATTPTLLGSTTTIATPIPTAFAY